MKKRIISFTAALAATAVLVCIFCVIRKEQVTARDNANRLFALQKLVAVSDSIQTELNESLQYADFFDVIISKDTEISKNTIYDYAKLILQQNKNIDSIQLAPKGIVSMIYPLKGNEAAIGHDLLKDTERKEYVEKAIEKRASVTQGPVKAKQGGYLVFNRKAIFVTENGKEQFWGLSIIAMNFDKLMEKYQKNLKNEKYLFALRANKGDKEQEILWGDYEIFNENAVVKTILLPDNEWEMAIYPKNGWSSNSKSLRNLNNFFYAVALLAFLLIYLCANFYQDKIEETKKEVLTGTLNKSALKAFVRKKLSQKDKKHGMILLDLNNFKDINDKFGHPVGDAVLIEVSKRISAMLRKTDRVSRFGGDEYIIFLSNIKNEDIVKQILQRTIEHVALPMVIDGLELKICISAGYAIYPDDGKTFDELYKIADEKMYECKQKNKILNRSKCLNI